MAKSKVSGWIEKYRFHIFVALLSAIISGGGVVLIATRSLKPEITIIQPSGEAPHQTVRGEIAGVTLEQEATTPSTPSTPSKPSQPSKTSKINLNTASKPQLESLPYIGPVKAQRIIDYRTAHPFQTIEEIKKVKGIGQKTFEKLQDKITVGE